MTITSAAFAAWYSFHAASARSFASVARLPPLSIATFRFGDDARTLGEELRALDRGLPPLLLVKLLQHRREAGNFTNPFGQHEDEFSR